MSIQLQQASIKIPLLDPNALDLEKFIPIFHEWIREHRIDDQLLIDVADYRHVPDGPGVMLIANEAHYGMDSGAGSVGLLYRRCRDELGDAEAALRDALKRASTAAAMIEKEASLGGALRFDVAHIEMRVMSRLAAPNTSETRDVLAPLWEQVLSSVGFAGTEFSPAGDPRQAFGLTVASSSKAPDLAGLLNVL